MAKYLVIVESPAKVKTVKKFLGSNYEVAASNGHVRDLPKSQLGIDIENDYEPKYITIRGKGELLASLRKEAKKADKVYLATDPDREGEAISWHLATALKLDEKKMRRITFNEITKSAVKESIKHARDIDMNLVDEQQTRRILDRMVGYRISPVLWKKIKRGLSAGRVQSVALRIIADREEEINAFIPEEYWSLDAVFKIPGEKKPLVAKFYGKEKEKMTISSREEADRIMEELKGVSYQVSEVKKGERGKKAPLPFTTSTLQQEASKALNFSTQKTMRLAQQLYEGVDIKGQGTVALISYLRTDSTRISEEADAMARSFIGEHYGESYVAVRESKQKEGKNIQCPTYDYSLHNRKDETIEIKPNRIILLEGILALQNEELRDMFDIKIFVEADADERILRRVVRDVKERGRDLEGIIEQYLTTVKPMHYLYVEPTRALADIVINSGQNEVAFDLVKTKIDQLMGEA